MAKYVYPAVFTPETDGSFSISFPDIEGCYSCGDSLGDGIEMAQDALSLVLFGYELEGKAIPPASALKDIPTNENEFVSYITGNTLAYQKRFRNKAVKKTLTIPEWMNELASAANLNFSQVLQDAIIEKLNLL